MVRNPDSVSLDPGQEVMGEERSSWVWREEEHEEEKSSSGSLDVRQAIPQSALTSVYSWGLDGPWDTCAGWGSLCPWVGIFSWAAEHMDPWFVVYMFLDI